ncbi:MAG: peptide chain release factor N(5)-glutamine methyltransferase [Streptosporangiales bacterium]|nr:peptide chain release factor N(5)-glutamine methyltransferase [Streptosporangiales bacterium]
MRDTGERADLRETLAAATERLRAAGLEAPRADAEILAAHVLGVLPARVALADAFTAPQGEAYDVAVDRRTAHEPVQHITGTAYFRHLTLAVGPGVFVPRPETESLAGWVVDALAGRDGAVVVDLCTGSAAVALAVATERPGVRVHAVEVDEHAYAWARRNVDTVAPDAVRLHLGDAREALHDLDGGVDVVVANPPYVPTGADVPADVRRDPELALYAGPDGLDGVRLVAGVAARLLAPGGLLACEHDDGHGEAAPALLRRLQGWTDVRDHDDLAGRPRFVTAMREPPT